MSKNKASLYGIYTHEQNFQLSDSFQKIYSVIRVWVAAIILTCNFHLNKNCVQENLNFYKKVGKLKNLLKAYQ